MIKLRKGVVFRDPQQRIREYCSIESYRGYARAQKAKEEIRIEL